MMKSSLGKFGIGETLTARVSYTNKISVPHNTNTDLCSIELPTGKWVLLGGFYGTVGNATFSEGGGWVTDVSVGSESTRWLTDNVVIPTGMVVTGATGGSSWAIPTGRAPVILNTPKTYYLVVSARYSSGGPTSFFGYMTFMCVG